MEQNLRKEKWKWIPCYTKLYEVSDWGRLKSYYTLIGKGKGYKVGKKGRLLHPFSTNGYFRVILVRNGKSLDFSVARLVLLAFVGPCPIGKECAHFDGNPKNDNLTNLRWATPKENQADRKRHGRAYYPGPKNPQKGEKHYSAKLTEKQVKKIRKEYTKGKKTEAELSRQYNVHNTTISLIIRQKTWRWLK